MPRPGRRTLVLTLLIFVCLSQSACDSVPRREYMLSRAEARQHRQHAEALAAERDNLNNGLTRLTGEHQSMQMQVGKLNSDLDVANQQLNIANQRLSNLATERGELQNRYVSLLKQFTSMPSTLPVETKDRFADLHRKYPNFDFDPATGVSKFSGDVQFAPGRAELPGNAIPLLKEFAAIMNQGSARELNVLIVGHTDGEDDEATASAADHPTHWHLSTDRANAVAMLLSRNGLAEPRIGVSGYGKFQPTAPNRHDQNRARNRRVEIFVLAPNAVVAGWDKPDRFVRSKEHKRR